MARPAPNILLETNLPDAKRHQVLQADAIYVLTYRHKPFAYRVVTPRYKTSGDMTYLRTTYPNQAAARNAAWALNAKFSTDQFGVKKIAF